MPSARAFSFPTWISNPHHRPSSSASTILGSKRLLSAEHHSLWCVNSGPAMVVLLTITGSLSPSFEKGFQSPRKKYYLSDPDYLLQKGILQTTCAVFYHWKEQAIACLRPAKPKELYNLYHSSLYNVVKYLDI
ncbi:uncharacterized protein VP01_4210g3 [Puccinia sorghi]|uniref:Uncharacterized protein n=1 Tax=Puccinia sorghi TaxID=27349 RepID=A0A0L6USP8_9BASI|nr:uncharacterized protein VP01_4210g3 [Puccinia sorghi]